MKILVDECLPIELKGTLAAMGHECQTVQQAGFGSKKNGELLTVAEGGGTCFSPAFETSSISRVWLDAQSPS
jgi:predicted nuclease of predicted toxin-antitoxin system